MHSENSVYKDDKISLQFFPEFRKLMVISDITIQA